MKEKIKMTHREKRENVAGFLFCLPCILGFLFFAAIPMIISFIMSFSDYSIVKESHFVGIDNYVRLFAGQDPYFYKSLTVTVIYVVFSSRLNRYKNIEGFESVCIWYEKCGENDYNLYIGYA